MFHVKQKENLVFEPFILESLLKGSMLSGFDRSSLALFINQNFSDKPAVFLFENNRVAFDFYETFESSSSLSVFYYPEKSDKAKVPGFISTNERYRQETLFKSIDCRAAFLL